MFLGRRINPTIKQLNVQCVDASGTNANKCNETSVKEEFDNCLSVTSRSSAILFFNASVQERLLDSSTDLGTLIRLCIDDQERTSVT